MHAGIGCERHLRPTPDACMYGVRPRLLQLQAHGRAMACTARAARMPLGHGSPWAGWMAGYYMNGWSIEAGRALRVAATHEVGIWLLAWIFLLASLPALLVGVWSACSRPLLGGRSSTTTSMLEASRPASQTAGLPVGAVVDAADRPGPRMHKLEEALIDDSRHRVVPHVGKVLLVWWHVIHLGPFARAERRST